MPTFQFSIIVVRLTGLEPAHREILDPKSSASTNSATSAKQALSSFAGAKVHKSSDMTKLLSYYFSRELNNCVFTPQKVLIFQADSVVGVDAKFHRLPFGIV